MLLMKLSKSGRHFGQEGYSMCFWTEQLIFFSYGGLDSFFFWKNFGQLKWFNSNFIWLLQSVSACKNVALIFYIKSVYKVVVLGVEDI